jgi:hypothetical protein
VFWEYTLTIPANTPASAPVESDVNLSPGTIVRVDVQFPRGCVGLVHVKIWKEEHQVWPVNVDGNIASEGQTVSWPEDYDVTDEPFTLTLRGWNLDDTFAHTITFRFALLELGAAQASRAGGGLLGRIAAALGIGA